MTIPLPLTRESERRSPSSLQEELSSGDPPPIAEIKGKTLVVKLGRSTLEHQRGALQDMLRLQAMGGRPVLVHGGGPPSTEALKTLHIATHLEQRARSTDARTIDG